MQYIHSSTNDDTKELSFLLSSSLLSSSPPSFNKNNLYLPNASRFEHKPWSFDVALTANQQTNGIPLPRRFFCLYRQPNSEHPDIYLHDFRNIDQFEFTINLPTDVDRIDFVLRYCVNGQEYWDNNDGKNYTLQTESAYIPSTTISLPHDCDFNEMRFY